MRQDTSTGLGNTNITSVGQEGLDSTDAQEELLDSLSSSFPKSSKLQRRELSRPARSLGSMIEAEAYVKPESRHAASALKVFGKAKQLHHGAMQLVLDNSGSLPQQD